MTQTSSEKPHIHPGLIKMFDDCLQYSSLNDYEIILSTGNMNKMEFQFTNHKNKSIGPSYGLINFFDNKYGPGILTWGPIEDKTFGKDGYILRVL